MSRKVILYIVIIFSLFVLLFCPPLLEKAFSLFSVITPSPESDSSYSQTPDSFKDTEINLTSAQIAKLTTLMQERYGDDVTLESSWGSLCTFTKKITVPIEGEFSFQAEYGNNPKDNYLQELLHFLGDSYRGGTMSLQWEEAGWGNFKEYTPVFVLHSRSGFSLESYCSDICNFLEYCMENEDFAQNSQILSSLTLSFAGQQTVYPEVSLNTYDRITFYNHLYTFADAFTVSVLNAANASEKENTSGNNLAPLSPDMEDYYLDLEPDCTFCTAWGTEYRMIGVDRAAGSSYYALIATEDNGQTCVMINPDPYNGSGGTSKWITFLDESLGFSCLAYSGGSYGSLYRTEDGGATFTSVEYPSANAILPDGTYYNPFVMPDEIYEENGQLFLVAGQGPEGDYYGKEGWCSGLYRSEDLGKSWIYVGEIQVEDTRP